MFTILTAAEIAEIKKTRDAHRAKFAAVKEAQIQRMTTELSGK